MSSLPCQSFFSSFFSSFFFSSFLPCSPRQSFFSSFFSSFFFSSFLPSWPCQSFFSDSWPVQPSLPGHSLSSLPCLCSRSAAAPFLTVTSFRVRSPPSATRKIRNPSRDSRLIVAPLPSILISC
ncbi:hypothetical protein C1I95_27030, partial [Micromonospora craterilacus]